MVLTDSDRLLKVWHAKEADPAATAVVAQLLDLLQELSSAPAPTLVVTDRIAHIRDYPQFAASEDEEEDEEEEEEEDKEEVKLTVVRLPAAPLSAPAPLSKAPVSAPAPAPVEEEEEEEEEEEVEEEVEEEAEEEAEEEEEEAEEEEEEEEAMEVEQIMIRGRAYWLETNTKKLYANDNDEVGDEVGVMVNGKALFLAK